MSSTTLLTRFQADFAITLFSCVVYGVYIVLAGLSTCLFVAHGRNYSGRRIVLAYTACMSVVLTVWLVASSRVSAYQFVDLQFNPDLPDTTCSAATIISKCAALLQILGSDAALIYRAAVVWEHDRRIVGPLTLLYFVLVGCGIVAELFCVSDALYALSPAMHVATFSISVVLNVLTTLAIATRLWYMRRRSLGVAPQGASRRVMVILAIIVESAALYTAFGLALIPTFIINSPAADVIVELFQGIAVLSPAAIFLRVAMGVSSDSSNTTLPSQLASRTMHSTSNSFLMEKIHQMDRFSSRSPTVSPEVC